LTRDLSWYSDVSVTADGSVMAAVQYELHSGIDVAPLHDGVPGAFAELYPISAERHGAGGIAWLSADRLSHTVMNTDGPQVFVTDVTSRSARALTSGASHHSPAVSRNGATMVVVRDDGDRSNLWRLDPDTGREQPLSDAQFVALPVVSADGAFALYSASMDTFKLLKVPAAGGAAVEVAGRAAWCFETSADDRDVLCFVSKPSGDSETVIIPLGGGEARPVANVPPSARAARFGPDRRSIVYLATNEGADELWMVPDSGAEPRRLVRFEGKEITDFAFSPDGSRLAVVKVTRSGDVVLLKR
jgi:Tol biopolymer transport system component